MTPERADAAVDVLVVGAGPTGLALAAQLRAHGVPFRIVDRQLDRVRESRALAIQPRTLEALAGFGISRELVARGNAAMRLRMHLPGRAVEVPLFGTGMADTPYPYLLFLSQAETEHVLGEHLAERGVTAERGTELTGLTQDDSGVDCRLRHGGGAEETVRARYVVGCDGVRSTVRTQAGIGFAGSAYPQTFLLADLEVDGLEAGSVHSYMTGAGMLFFFPLGDPVGWRMLAMRPPGGTPQQDVGLQQLQALVDAYSGEGLRLRDPVWMTDFRIHHRGADRYRAGRVFLAGDAAHVHSPAGAQGMNTGIQDALNLGWKLAPAGRGTAPEELLDTYEAERAPVGERVVRFTDRAFTVATGRNPALRLARTRIAPRLAPVVLRSSRLRARFFRTVSELGIHYRRSPLSEAGARARGRGPRAGDRLPDVPAGLQERTAAPGFHVLLGGERDAWPDEQDADAALNGRPGLAGVHRLGRNSPWSSAPVVAAVRPDGYLGYVAAGADLTGLRAYLDRWLPHR